MEDNNKGCTPEVTDREGTSAFTRFVQMLDPVNAPIDPRDTKAILVFAKHYAELVRFYDFDDTLEGIIPDSGNSEIHNANTTIEENQIKDQIITWKDFFYNDIAVVVASISQYQSKLWHIKKEYNDIRNKIESNPTKENYRELFLCIIHHLKRINRWYERSVEGHPLKSELEVKIKSFLVPALKKLIAYDKGMLVNTQDDLDLISQYEGLKNEPWNCDYNVINLDATIYVGNDPKQKIIYALMYVDDIFNTMYKSYEEITQRSGYYWQQAIENYPSHQPHIALFISFVELFSHAKNELNNLTKRHLEFFYRDVLHLKEKPANPDSVYLIYQLAKGVEEFDLKQGTELTAGKDALGKQLVYKTDKDLVINSAKVKELKTIFFDKTNSIKNIYAASVANSADGKGEKFKDAETAWSTFGYFEPRNEGDKITGEKAQLGIAFATPQFNLSQSDRTIDIKISFENKKKDKNGNDERIKVTSNDYEIYFTGKKDWISPIVETETEDFQLVSSKSKITVPNIFKVRLFNFLNSIEPLDVKTLAPEEHFLGPIFDNSAYGKSDNKDDYDLDETAKVILNKKEELKLADGIGFSELTDLSNLQGIGDDKIHDLIYSFSNKIVVADNKERVLLFRTRIQPQQDAIASPEKEFKNFNFKTQYPVCKIVFNQESDIYETLKDIAITKVEITVKVTGLTDIIVENDDGNIDPKKEFYPFSAKPAISSSLMLGAREFENKNIDYFSANVEWKGNLDFENRYQGYVDLNSNPTIDDNPRKDYSNYQGNVEVFIKNNWLQKSIKTTLKSSETNKDEPIKVDSKSEPLSESMSKITRISFNAPIQIQLFGSNVGGIAKWNISPFQTDGENRFYSQSVAGNNFKLIKVVINQDFGHELYPTLIAQYLAKRKKIIKGGQIADCKDGDNDIFIPSTPVEVKVKTISFDYTSSQILKSSNSQFFHIYPFGETEIFNKPDNDFQEDFDDAVFRKLLKKEMATDHLIVPTTYMLPQFKFGNDANTLKKLKVLNNQISNRHKEFISNKYFQFNQYRSLTDQQGNLYIGIQDIKPPQNLSLLFKFADGTAYDNDSEPPKINWSYLANNEWLPLSLDRLISDSTYGFQTTGIILFDFPDDSTSNNTLTTNGLHWLCASIDKDGDRIPKLIDVIAQANLATFFDQQNDQAHYKNALPEKCISKPLVKIPEVKIIDQPFESFDGKPREEGNQFYQRVSERLRHKGRAITPRDYEHLVLEQFPSVYKVKILSHSDPQCLCRHSETPVTMKDCCCPQVAPGHILVIPISNLRNKNAIDPLKPRTGRRTLLKIEEFLKKRVSPFVHVHAKNPKFEEVKVSFNVKFYTGIDKGFYKRKLNDDLVQYLSPWAYDSNFEVLFANKIYASKIINFIEELDFVDYITCFRMIHITDGCCDDTKLKDMDCDEMQGILLQSELGKNAIKTYIETEGKTTGETFVDNSSRFLYEVSATSPQAILVSAKQHCISIIEDEPSVAECNRAKVTEKKYPSKPNDTK